MEDVNWVSSEDESTLSLPGLLQSGSAARVHQRWVPVVVQGYSTAEKQLSSSHLVQ